MLAALLLPTQIPKVPARLSPVRAELRLTVDRASVAPDEDPGWHAVIRNLGRTPLRLSDPQNRTLFCRENPFVAWITPDFGDAGDPCIFLSGLSRIVASRFFTLAPGESHELDPDRLAPPDLARGSNRVSVTYRILSNVGYVSALGLNEPPTETLTARVVREAERDRVLAGYAALTPISLRSNVVRVTLRSAP